MASDCIEHQGYVGPNGYGRAYLSGHGEDGAHKIAWIKAFGPVPKGLDVCHTCDNRKCINVDHLWLGTRSENILDAVKKGRMPQTEANHHKRKGRLTCK